MPTTTGKIYLGSTLIAGGGGAAPSEWVRPAEWPVLTIPEASEQKVTGVYAVWPPVSDEDTTWLAMLFEGAYTVDWGDGSATEDIATNTKCEHQFDWANCTSAAVDVNTAVAGTLYYVETLGDTSQADWNTLAGTTGLTYAAGDSFTAAVAGSTLSNSTGTVSTVPYRFAIVSVVPQAGQSLTTINLSQQPNAGTYCDVPQWLDLAISAAGCTSLALRGANSVELHRVERVTIVAHSVTDVNSMFANCHSLQSVPLFDTSAVTNMSSMFTNCYSLQSVPLFDTSAATNTSNMFNGCSGLRSVPLFDTSAVTNTSSMFNGCSGLRSVPLFDTSAATNTGSMFNSCSSLQSVPLFDTSAATNTIYMFRDCHSLQSVPLFDTSAATNTGSMFRDCRSLQSVPLFDMSAATNIGGMFHGCKSLQSVPLFDTSAVTNISSMFQNCYSLESVPLFDMSAATNTSSMFNNCHSLQSVPLFDMSAATNTSSMFNGCKSLHTIRITGTSVALNIANCNLSGTALDFLYTNLADVTGNPQTITVTGNPGVTTHDPTIATAKGWTVTA